MSMISVKDFCEKYDCDVSGVYKKIKHNHEELEGHVVKQDSVYYFDEEAERFLVPKYKKCILEKNAEAYRLEETIENLKKQIQELKDENDEIQKKYDFIFQQNQKLEKENSELHGRMRSKGF